MKLRLLSLLVLLMLGESALAQVPAGCVDLTWTPPTTNTDGTPLTNLASYVAYAGPAPGMLNTSTQINNPSATSLRWCSQPVGLRYFAVAARNTSNVESMISNLASKLIVGAAPSNPPTVPQPVTLGGLVFTLLITTDSMVLPDIGTVVAGRACDPTQQIAFNGTAYMRVNAALVTPYAGQRVEAAWARCQ